MIESLVTLLKSPNADNPLEAEIAELFSKDYGTFCAFYVGTQLFSKPLTLDHTKSVSASLKSINIYYI